MIGAAYRTAVKALYLASQPYMRLKASRGSRMWRSRLLLDVPDGPVEIWIHAASVGEAKMAGILIAHIKRRRPDLRIHLTVMTQAGFDTISNRLPEGCSLSFFPLDVPSLVTRLIDRLYPRVIVIAETEIWPNMVTQAGERSIPLVLVNGRMSPEAFRNYKLARGLFARLLSCYTRLFIKSEDDMTRFREFGVSEKSAEVVGDMKFDAPLEPHSEGRRRELRYRVGIDDQKRLLVAGSTRPGEEEMLLQIYKRLRKSHPEFRMLIAPRHLDRIGEIKQLLSDSGAGYRIYGDLEVEDHNIILVDRMGILNDLYIAADIAFVGGTLVDIGGHNILEPVWAGTPVLYGPSVHNVTEAADYVEKHNFGARVSNPEELAGILERFLDGQVTFQRRTEENLQHSATVRASHYILSLLDGAAR